MSRIRKSQFTRRRRHPKVKQSPPTQETPSTPAPSSKSSETWTSLHPHKYLNKGAAQDIWEKCNEVVERHDENFCNDLKDEITFLMIVAGLFLAIVTAFTIESYKSLQEDKQDTMSDLLVEVVRLLNDTSAQGSAQLPKRFTTDHRDVVVNQLWYMSSTLSLVAVLIGTYCLQWISAYQRGTDLRDKSLSPTDVLGMRRLRYEGFIGWHVHHAPEVLLLIVQLSIALFTSGLIYFLWNVNHAAAIPALVVASITSVLLCVVNVMPFLQSLIGIFHPPFLTLQCPYKSPTSWLVRIVFDSFALALKRVGKQWDGYRLGVAGRFAFWLQNRPAPLKDYVWKAYDKSCEALLDAWRIRLKSDSIGSGLSSALDILLLEPDAVDIIRHSMESLRLTFNKAENLLSVFDQTLDPLIKPIFNGLLTVVNDYTNTVDGHVHFSKFLDDFTSALILQNLANRSTKLRRILLPHRIELYIRTKNSMSHFFNPNEFFNTVKSLAYPLVDDSDIQSFDLEHRFQFLNYLIHFLRAQYPLDHNDFIVAAQIISSEGLSIGCPYSPPCPACSRRGPVRYPRPYYTEEPNWVENNGLNPSGVQRPNRGNQGLVASSQHGTNGDRTEDPHFRASFRRLCCEARKLLLSLPEPFRDVNISLMRNVILRNHPQYVPVQQPSPLAMPVSPPIPFRPAIPVSPPVPVPLARPFSPVIPVPPPISFPPAISASPPIPFRSAILVPPPMPVPPAIPFPQAIPVSPSIPFQPAIPVSPPIPVPPAIPFPQAIPVSPPIPIPPAIPFPRPVQVSLPLEPHPPHVEVPQVSVADHPPSVEAHPQPGAQSSTP